MATTIGEALRRARKQRGLSLRDLEKMTKMSSSQISHVETGIRADPAFGTVAKLARAIGVTMDSLFEVGEDEEHDVLTELQRVQSDTLRTLRKLERLIEIEIAKRSKSKAATRRKKSSGS